MTETLEDSPPRPTASIRGASRGEARIASLVEACVVAAFEPRGPRAVERVLGLALDACAAERAFLIRGEPRDDGALEPIVEAYRVVRAIPEARPSRTVALWALARGAAFVCLDTGHDQALAHGQSVRDLGLRFVLAAPVREAAGEKRALVLDSRSPAAPSTADELLQLVRGFAALIALGSGPLAPSAARPGLAARSAAMAATLAWIERVAPTDLPVLIRGESGSGKEVVARRIHELSPRRGRPYVAVSCTELAETLIEAELFGSERGAFTGAVRDRPGVFRSAQGGTLLLDEIGDMPLPLQAKLLRALQEKTVRPVGGAAEVAVDVRLLTATHRDLDRAVREGTFRSDLYYRLTVTEIAVPPLRQRLADLGLLVADVGARLARETGFRSFGITAEAMAVLRSHDWPGNVRELQSVLARALLRSSGAPIEPAHLGSLSRPAPKDEDASPNLELEMIRAALREGCGSIALAARRIGWSRQKLYRRMTALSLR